MALWLITRESLNRLLNLRFLQELGICPELSRCCICQEILRTSELATCVIVFTYSTDISVISCPWWHTCTFTVIPFPVKREAPRVVYTFCWIQNNEHHSPRTSISPLSSQTFKAFVVFFFALFPSLIKTQNFANIVLLQTVNLRDILAFQVVP
jgi:recombinational DNA repair protein (RecF pathway)